MRLLENLRRLKQQSLDNGDAFTADRRSLPVRLLDVTLRTWHLGFTAFGGPAVQFQAYRRRFVYGEDGGTPWVDNQTYQELLGLCQSTPGPASTKLLTCLIWIHAGPLPAIWVFVLWSLPTALGMLALGLGIQRVDDTLPAAVYAFLSGLNAAIVGVIALAAIDLSRKSMVTQLDRALIIFGACAGVCYSSLWYFPVIIVSGGIITLAWQYGARPAIVRIRVMYEARQRQHEVPQKPVDDDEHDCEKRETAVPQTKDVVPAYAGAVITQPRADTNPSQAHPVRPQEPVLHQADTTTYKVGLRLGVGLLAAFLITVISLLVVSRTIFNPRRPLQFTANMVLAGSIIFGGGPVLIPLMRDYVVQPGWVTPRDFLIGLAIISIFPGPNFNFAVYLGVLSMIGTQYSTVLGGFLGFIGIFTPGVLVAIAFMAFWRALRKRPYIVALLKGVNCTATGLIFTAVYRIWQIGYLSTARPEGRPLGDDPWWLVVTVVAYSISAWLKVPTAAAIVLGGIMGLVWYGVTTT